MESIYLVGFMGSGKSTIGTKLAEKVKLQFIDTDDQIELDNNKQITAIFAEDGEATFRNLEHQVLVNTPSEGHVIATGGGIVEKKENRSWLLNKHVVYLKTSWETIAERLASDESRPIWQDQSRDKKHLLAERDQKYNQIATQIIETNQLSIDQIVDQIVDQIQSSFE